MSMALALISLRYFVGLGPLPPKIVANSLTVPWLAIHVAAAAVALLLGAPQFLVGVRRRRPRVHRWTGRGYALACIIGAVSGIMLAVGTTMGPFVTASFVSLSLIWLYVTGRGWLLARRRDHAAHRRWMIRSFALTFSAVNLRLYLGAALALDVPFDIAYPPITLLAWFPNLLAAEAYLRRPAGRDGRKPSTWPGKLTGGSLS